MSSRLFDMTSRLVARYGGAATLTAPGGFAGPEWDPIPLPATSYAVQLIDTGADQELVAGGVVQAHDLLCVMLPHASITPTTAHSLTVYGKTYALLSVQPVQSKPDGPVIHFRLHGRV